jgi:hypothetical protein
MNTSTLNYEVESEVVVVTFPIPPIRDEFREELSTVLFEEVWGNRREVEEHIYVGDRSTLCSNSIDSVRYQFGSINTASQDADEIAGEIQRCLEKWCASKGGYDQVAAKLSSFEDGVAVVKSLSEGANNE